MGLLAKILAAETTTFREPASWFYDSLAGGASSAGERVGPVAALGLPAYWACLKVVSEDCGKLPLMVYERQGTDRRSKRVAYDHPAYSVLHLSPNPFCGSMTLRETMVSWALGWGNAIAELQFTGGGDLVGIWPIHPARVTPEVKNNRLRYVVHREDGGQDRLTTEQVIHLRGPGDTLWGYSVVQLLRDSIGVGLAGQRLAGAWFSQGAPITGVLEHPGNPEDTTVEKLRASMKARFGPGGADRGGFIILREGMTYKPLHIAPEDLQFIESRNFTVEEICRLFRVSPHKIQHLVHATFSNVSHLGIEHGGDAIMPWLKRFEEELARKVFVDDAQFFAEHNMAALMRADHTARAEFYSKLFGIGVLSPNMVLQEENFNPVDGGDEHFIPANMVPLRNPVQPQPASSAGVVVDDLASEDETAKHFTPVLAGIIGRTVAKECKALGRSFGADYNRRAFLAKAENLYREIRDDLRESLGPSWTYMQRASTPGAAITLAQAVEQYISESWSELVETDGKENAAARIAEWQTSKADRWAQRLNPLAEVAI